MALKMQRLKKLSKEEPNRFSTLKFWEVSIRILRSTPPRRIQKLIKNLIWSDICVAKQILSIFPRFMQVVFCTERSHKLKILRLDFVLKRHVAKATVAALVLQIRQKVFMKHTTRTGTVLNIPRGQMPDVGKGEGSGGGGEI